MKKRSRIALLLALVMALTMCLSSIPAVAEEKEPVVITIATWQNVIFLEEMVAKFNELNPDIIAKVDDFGGWFDHTALSTRAAEGNMPDVFVITTPEVPVSNGWMMDLTPYLEAEENKTWYDATVLKYDGKTYMLPYSIFFYGVIVNKTLLSELNIDIPGYDWTMDDFMDIVQKASTGGYYGMVDPPVLYNHGAAQLNPETGWGLINMNLREYNLDDTFLKTVGWAKDMYDKKYAAESIVYNIKDPDPDTQTALHQQAYQDALGVESAWYAWQAGKVALIPEFSWSMNLTESTSYSGFDYDFYPFPRGSADSDYRSGIVADAAGINAGTEHPDEAFRLLKFFTYDPAGFDARVEISQNYNKEEAMAKYPQYEEGRFLDVLSLSDLPGAFTPEVLSKWSELNNVKPGVAYCIAGIPTGYLDGYKCVPGWAASQWEIIGPAIENEILTGEKAAADIAAELKEKADAAVAEAYAAMGIE